MKWLVCLVTVVNTYLGMTLPKSEQFLAKWVKYVLIAFGVLYIIVIIVLEVDRRFVKPKAGR